MLGRWSLRGRRHPQEGIAAALYGNVTYNGLQFGVDAVRVFVESPSYWRGQNGIYHSTMTNSFTITSVTTPSQVTQAIYLCTHGLT
jgi:hypothetical protein